MRTWVLVLALAGCGRGVTPADELRARQKRFDYEIERANARAHLAEAALREALERNRELAAASDGLREEVAKLRRLIERRIEANK